MDLLVSIRHWLVTHGPHVVGISRRFHLSLFSPRGESPWWSGGTAHGGAIWSGMESRQPGNPATKHQTTTNRWSNVDPVLDWCRATWPGINLRPDQSFVFVLAWRQPWTHSCGLRGASRSTIPGSRDHASPPIPRDGISFDGHLNPEIRTSRATVSPGDWSWSESWPHRKQHPVYDEKKPWRILPYRTWAAPW